MARTSESIGSTSRLHRRASAALLLAAFGPTNECDPSAPGSSGGVAGGGGGYSSAATGDGGGESTSNGSGGSAAPGSGGSAGHGGGGESTSTGSGGSAGHGGGESTSTGSGGSAGHGGGESTSTGSGGSLATCAPGSIIACYSGPEGTNGVGRCTAGTQTCRPDGFGYGPCTGEITPAAEVCATPQDESCDGDSHCPRPAAWARGFGIETTWHSSSIAVDATGNYYIIGTFEGSVDLGTGPLTSAGDSDIFLLKLDPSGAPLWSKRFGTPLRERGNALAMDGNGNVLIAGNYQDDLSGTGRDPGFGGCALPAPFSSSGQFMAKLDPDGNHIWSDGFSFYASYSTRVTEMAIDAHDNAYLAIELEDVTAVVKLDAMGNVLWTRSTPGSPSFHMDLALDSAGNVVTVDYAGINGNYTGLYTYVSKLSPNGDLLWSRTIDDYDFRGKVAVNSAGEILVLAEGVLIKLDQDGEEVFTQPVRRTGNIAVDPADNIFLGGGGLTMLDPSGTELWTLDFAASVGDIAFSPNGAVAVTGFVLGPVDFGTGPIAHTEGEDMYAATFNPPASGDSGEGGGGSGGSGGSGGGGGEDPSETCVPGSVIACYSGPAGTRGVGRCAAGTQTCRSSGLGFGACVGEVTPAEDICSTPEDENCDGDPHCPMLSWARGFGSAGADEGLNIASDAAGNYYVAGTFTGPVDFGVGPLTSTPSGGQHFLLKLDPSGAPLWSERLAIDRPLVMAVDGNGDLLLAGAYSPDGAMVLNQCLPPFPAYNVGAFVAKFDRDGNLIWSQAPIYPPDSFDIYSYPERIAVDALGNTYLVFVNVWTDGAYLLKLSPGGDVLWNHVITPPPAEYEHPLYSADLAIDSAGNALTVTAPESAAGNLTVSKRDPTGAVLWSRPFAPDPSIPPGGAGEVAWSVAVNAADEVFVAGITDGTIDLGGGVLPAGPVLLKLDAAGAYVFSDSIPFGDTLALDPAGNIVVAGSGLAKLDPSGAELWSLSFGASAHGITISPTGMIALTGAASAAVDFGTGPISHAGGSDIFVATFNP
ncbi:outer membrane protein assembly factor BamB family protein [Sorangium sp. So ce233]|uniref:outer membrane protein assembly factor BamB family protein n=1 Tax=Sorangium sp. So ce233 TaxID=3133290 RepID=UPI003F63AA04